MTSHDLLAAAIDASNAVDAAQWRLIAAAEAVDGPAYAPAKADLDRARKAHAAAIAAHAKALAIERAHEGWSTY